MDRNEIADRLVEEYEWWVEGDSPRHQEAYKLVNFVADHLDPDRKAIHEGRDWPASFDWDNLATHDGTYLGRVGQVIVDGASVIVTIGENKPDVRFHFFTPDGDGAYNVLAGRVRGIGRCVVIAFDLPDPATPDWSKVTRGESDDATS
jgi:hypothetical protein